MYRLKNSEEAFQIVDGPFAGRKFVRGKDYREIPPGYDDRFEQVKIPSSSPLPKGGKRKSGTEGGVR